MSFAKAKTKRFNEEKSCAPPPGHYDPKAGGNVQAVIMGQTDRFRENKENTPGPYLGLDETCASVSGNAISTPKKSLQFNTTKPPQPGKATKPLKTTVDPKIRELEKEVRHLVMERTDLDKRLRAKEDEVGRLDGRLVQTQKDRSALQAKAATLEKQLMELDKANNHLKSKVSANQGNVERHKTLMSDVSSLKAQLERKSTELTDLSKQHTHSRETLQADITKAKQSLKDLTSEKDNLESSHREIEKRATVLSSSLSAAEGELTRVRNDKVRAEERLAAVQSEEAALRERLEQTLRDAGERVAAVRNELETESSAAKQQHESTLARLQENLADSESTYATLASYKDALLGEVAGLKETIRLMKLQKLDHEDQIRHLKGELFVAVDTSAQYQETLEQAQRDVATLSGLISHLQASESMLQDNVKTLTERYQYLETNLVSMEVEAHEKVVDLEQQVASTRFNQLEAEEECERLSAVNQQLMQGFNTEKCERVELDCQLSAMQTTVTGLREQLAESEAAVIRLRELDETKSQAIRELNTEKGALSSRLLQSEHDLTETRAEAADNIMHLQLELCQEQEHVCSLREQLNTAQRQIDKVTDLEMEVSSLEKEVDDRAVTIELLNGELARNKTSFEEQSTQIEQLNEDLAETKTQLEDSEANLISSQKMADIEQSRANDAEKKLEQHIADVQQDVAELVQVRQELLEVRSELVTVQSALATVKEELSAALQEAKKEQSRADSLQQTLTATQQAQSMSQQIMQQMESKLNDKHQELEDALSEAAEKANILQTEFDNTQVELSLWKNKADTAKDDLESTKSKLSKAQDEILKLKEVEDTLTETRSQLSEKEAMVNEFWAEMSEKRRRLDEAWARADSLKVELAARDSLIEEHKGTIASLQLNITNVPDKTDVLSQLEAENAKLRKDKALTDSEKSQLHKEKVEIEQQLIVLRHELTMQQTDARSQLVPLQERVSELEHDLEKSSNRRERLGSAMTEMQSERENMLEELDNLRSEMSEEQQKVNESENTKARNLQQIEDLQDQLHSLKRNSGEELRRMACERDEAETHSAAAQTQLTQCQRDLTDVVEKLQLIEESHLHELTELKLQHTEKLSNVQEQLNLKQLEVEQLVSASRVQKEDCEREYDSRLAELAHDMAAGASQTDVSDMQNEMKKWKQMYEDLWSKVKPFQEQLDAFAAERNALLSQSANAQSEMTKLSREYAKLLGHQNQKQKIHHVLKLKEENIGLNKEITKLHETVEKFKRKAARAEEELRKSEGRKKFDPSKAFEHAKENKPHPGSPLRESNRKGINHSSSPHRMRTASPFREGNR